MLILYEGSTIPVYAIYWGDAGDVRQRLYCAIFDDNDASFTIVPQAKSEIIDPSVNNFVLTKLANGGDAFIHKYLTIDNLLGRIIDHDDGAMREFLRLLQEDQEDKN